MSVSHCLKRFPLVSFPRYYASAATARATKTVASDADITDELARVKKRAPRAKKPKPEPKPPPPILESSKIQDHLEQLAESNGILDLDDLERYRPSHRPSIDAPDYEEKYNALLEKITGAFTLNQLTQFIKLYGIDVPSAQRKKKTCAGAIMEKEWEWTSLSTIAEKKKATAMTSQTFPLSPYQAFLILGIDGADSHSLSIKYHAAGPSDHFALNITGKGAAVKQLADHIANLTAAIAEEVFDSPIKKPMKGDVLRRISRLSGALTENFGREQIRVSYNGGNPRSASIAKRLTARAAREASNPMFFHLPPSIASSSLVPESNSFPHTYSMYPFSSPRSLPWAVSPGGVFRLRRVEEWLGTGASEDLTKTGGLMMGRGRTVSSQREDVDLRALLLQARLPHSPSFSSRVVLASIGHILLTSPPTAQGNIDPPLQGQWKLPHIMSWIEKRSEPNVFNPTLPTALLNSHPSRHRMLHRLVYRVMHAADAVAPDIIKVEFVLPRSAEEPSNEGSDFAEPEFHPSCWLGHNSDVDVMMPDRATDIRFSVFDSDILPAHQWPSKLELEEYIQSFRAYSSSQDRDTSRSRPEPPLIVTHNDIAYLLHSSSTVQQNVEETGDSSSVKVITESVFDLEAAQKSSSCQVLCNDVGSDVSWQSFLRQCDIMSTVTPAPSSSHRNITPLL
ncbi:hypothetical protein B0H17DRAFT_1035513 [Mycena rosella]|uniref:SLS1 C-terminal domain-containing protein n=1 Tax=Mycena rosella TaxID=1033263 RepID=A0AAD7GVD2_MYCRO|nr:hypothetical protein B0H17DRAFT_1035513 [Mycena rosella]